MLIWGYVPNDSVNPTATQSLHAAIKPVPPEISRAWVDNDGVIYIGNVGKPLWVLKFEPGTPLDTAALHARIALEAP